MNTVWAVGDVDTEGEDFPTLFAHQDVARAAALKAYNLDAGDDPEDGPVDAEPAEVQMSEVVWKQSEVEETREYLTIPSLLESGYYYVQAMNVYDTVEEAGEEFNEVEAR